MSGIAYPALFHKENESYWVEFPDLEGCFSSGKTLTEAANNAREALELYLDQSDDVYPRMIKKPSSVNDYRSAENTIVMMINTN